MSYALIRGALQLRLSAWAAAQSPALEVSWENVKFQPGVRYVRVHLLKSPTQSRGLSGTHRHYSGILQVDLCLPDEVGTAETEALASSLDAEFPLTDPIEYGGIDVWITAPMSPATGYPNGTHYVTPVSGTYECHTV